MEVIQMIYKKKLPLPKSCCYCTLHSVLRVQKQCEKKAADSFIYLLFFYIRKRKKIISQFFPQEIIHSFLVFFSIRFHKNYNQARVKVFFFRYIMKIQHGSTATINNSINYRILHFAHYFSIIFIPLCPTMLLWKNRNDVLRSLFAGFCPPGCQKCGAISFFGADIYCMQQYICWVLNIQI